MNFWIQKKLEQLIGTCPCVAQVRDFIGIKKENCVISEKDVFCNNRPFNIARLTFQCVLKSKMLLHPKFSISLNLRAQNASCALMSERANMVKLIR